MFEPEFPDSDTSALEYVITHVFCPLQLPDKDYHSIPEDNSEDKMLFNVALIAARAYSHLKHLSDDDKAQWHAAVSMLEILQTTVEAKSLNQDRVTSHFRGMKTRDTLALLIRAQNTAVIFRKQSKDTFYMSFGVPPSLSAVKDVGGKLTRSYAGHAINIPNAVFEDESFQSELANFLARMHEDIPDILALRGGITNLLTGILRAVGHPAEVEHISKCVAIRKGPDLWRRSPFWHLVTLSIQTALGTASCKLFTLFFMSCLVKEAVRVDLSPDILHFMSVKISRRLRKLGASTPAWLSHIALEACSSFRKAVEESWKFVQDAQSAPRVWTPSQLDLVDDTQLSLPDADKYISDALMGHQPSPRNISFHPIHHPRGTLDTFLSSHGTFFEKAYRHDPFVTLYDVEQAVEQSIDDWIAHVTDIDDACIQLKILAENYLSAAGKTYVASPENTSVMLLTEIDLWVALDKLAVRQIPLLADYSPEVPLSLLQGLLLRKTVHLYRLRCAYQYLSARHARSHKGWTVFDRKITGSSLAVRYYETSAPLQQLKISVKERAQQLETAYAQQTRLLDRASTVGRNYINREQYVNLKDVLVIPMHAAVLMFELQPPVAFDVWRSATLHFLGGDLLGVVSHNHPIPGTLSVDSLGLLQGYLAKSPWSCITPVLYSTPVDHVVGSTRFRHRRADFHNNQISYQSRTCCRKPFITAPVERPLSYQLQDADKHPLQKYVDDISHTPNEVIAGQWTCPKDLSLREYIAFGHLRSGSSLQWFNILRELRLRSLSFRRHEVHLLLAQAASQVGPFVDGPGWTWHQELQEPLFCFALIGELETLLRDVEANQQEVMTMGIISLLLSRLFAASLDPEVSGQALRLLSEVRKNTFFWVKELLAELMEASTEETHTATRWLLLDSSAVCRSTFDVISPNSIREAPDTLRSFLYSSESIDILISCAISIHDHTPEDRSVIPAQSRLLLERDRRLSLTLEDVLRDIMKSDPLDEGLNRAVRRARPAYRPGPEKWKPLEYPSSRWLTCRTAATESQASQTIHLNLLDGTLLVDGRPLDKLPDAVMQHPVYSLVFGNRTFDVVPSDLRGMDFSSQQLVFGHQIHFALRHDELIIRAKLEDGYDVFQLVPQEKLERALPTSLVEGHVHWLKLSSAEPKIEIRPLEKAWEISPENWFIHCSPDLQRYKMLKGTELHPEVLVDMGSPTLRMVSGILEVLDGPEHLIVTVTTSESKSLEQSPHTTNQLSVTLPRYGLSFFVDEDGDLQSHNFKDMVYDENQSIGTMFGLVNLLVLRPKSHAAEFLPRSVLIPEGNVNILPRHGGHHVSVKIEPRGSRIKYQTYTVDNELGCLSGNVSLASKLYRAYLHAVTSNEYCTDPLTGRTGIEEATCLLQSAGCRSLFRLEDRDAELLHMIASLCTPRVWVPQLATILQYDTLYAAARAIKDHCERVQLLHDDNKANTSLQTFPERRRDPLSEHYTARSAQILSFELRGQFPRAVDREQADQVELGQEEFRAYTAASAIWHVSYNTPAGTDIWKLMNSLSRSGTGTALAASGNLSPGYTRAWLELGSHFPSMWAKAYNLLREAPKAPHRSRFQLLFAIPAMVFGKGELDKLVPAFLAFATHPEFRLEDPPNYTSYNLSDGSHPSREVLRDYILDCQLRSQTRKRRVSDAVKGLLEPVWPSSNQIPLWQLLDRELSDAVKEVLVSWPSETALRCSFDRELYDVERLNTQIQTLFSSCYRNLMLKEHLTRIQSILGRLEGRSLALEPESHSFYEQPPGSAFQLITIGEEIPPPIIVSKPHSFDPVENASPPEQSSGITMADLFLCRSAPQIRAPDRWPRHSTRAKSRSSVSAHPELHRLIATVQRNASNLFQRRYVSDLSTSAQHLLTEDTQSGLLAEILPVQTLSMHLSRCRDNYFNSLDSLKEALGPRTDSDQVLYHSGLWPRVTAEALFCCLASVSSTKLPTDWKKCLVSLALLALELQRARRLLRLAHENLDVQLAQELEINDLDGWNPEENSDWLLIQLQANFLIRPMQVNVANEIIAPQSGKNTVMQLNMGEGKSSVIIPISAATLADGNQLVRVIVPKALTLRMFHLLVERLGGLTNRRIFYLPISRSIKVTAQRLLALHDLLFDCMRERGILVAQPEHVLSLKLACMDMQMQSSIEANWLHIRIHRGWPISHQGSIVTIEKPQIHVLRLTGRLYGDGVDPAGPLLSLQRWLHESVRDILDECDEILHPRFQLVYTLGSQRGIEGVPWRWITIQQVLRLVKHRIHDLRTVFPLAVDFEPGPPGSFPRINILLTAATHQLVSWIAQDAIEHFLPSFNPRQVRTGLRNAVVSFLSQKDVPSSIAETVMEHTQHDDLWKKMLLIRGLLAAGILQFALQEKRWRVNYGLAPMRSTMLAVPYQAKDLPAPKAEFGHPDVTIILTCLSFYYAGLSESQLRHSFEILLKLDDPSPDYALWTQGCPSLPDPLRHPSAVNLTSSEQWSQHLVPLFMWNQATVDFYLSRVVFPKEAVEFPFRLSASNWDLAERRKRIITGFSGTNDGQYLLPVPIGQRDLDHQRGTNGRVLSYLLQVENNSYMAMAHQNGEPWSTLDLLQQINTQKHEIRVLLDVGAQVLDLQNHQLAQAWLNANLGASAAIYFNDDDELMVLARDGSTLPLFSSPFAQQLGRCIVYLDDAHTRGTDLKLPSEFRAAVTLGPQVTKDRLTQGCMRMRMLGHGHSVMFLAPKEVDQSIRSLTAKGTADAIDALDILQWSIHQTCHDIQRSAPYWAQQGMDHASRHDAWVRFCKGEITPRQLSKSWIQEEAKSLAALYAPRNDQSTISLYPEIHQRCVNLGLSDSGDAGMDEEQEREIIYEKEHEAPQREHSQPEVASAVHSTHPDVVSFVETGIIPSRSSIFQPIFMTLANTSAATSESHVWSPFVLATQDFCHTVESPTRQVGDYLRPVQWVVSSKAARDQVLVLLSPFEANALLPSIRRSENVHLHIYAPRTTKSMRPCDDLRLISIPPVPEEWNPPCDLIDQLNVFAGQLYFTDYQAYTRLCRFLCVNTRVSRDNERVVAHDGFIPPDNRAKNKNTFQRTPLPSLRALVALRTKGRGFTETHMGSILEGRVLSERDFEG